MWRTVRLFTLIVALTVLGSAGFYFIEGWPLLDSVYMAVITLTTVGYNEVHELSSAGRLFVILYLVLGLGLFFYTIVEVARILLETQLQDWLRERRMHKELKNLRDHYIICGFGTMGKKVAQHLADRRLPFVVVDNNPEVVDQCKLMNWPWLLGDATDDQVLTEAGIHDARGLATVLPGDAENVYVVLTARMLSSDLQIIARASDERVVSKLDRAGANRVVSMYAAGATKITQLLTNPQVEEFLEVINTRDAEVDMAEIEVSPTAPFLRKSLAESGFSERGLIIVGIRSADGKLTIPPSSQQRIGEGDLLIAAGKSAAVRALIEEA